MRPGTVIYASCIAVSYTIIGLSFFFNYELFNETSSEKRQIAFYKGAFNEKAQQLDEIMGNYDRLLTNQFICEKPRDYVAFSSNSYKDVK